MNNKKTLIRAICILSAAAMMMGAFTACGKKSESDPSVSDSDSKGNGNKDVSAEDLVKLNYSCEQIKLPEEFANSYLNSFSVVSDGVLMTYFEYDYDEETQTSSMEAYICKTDFEGNIVSKTDISPEMINDQDSVGVQNVNYLEDGSVLYFESHYYPDYSAEAPSGSSEEAASVETSAASSQYAEVSDSDASAVAVTEMAVDESVDYADEVPVEYKNQMFVVKLAADGTVSEKKDISEIPSLKFISDNQNNYISNININSSGDIAVAYQTYDENWNSQTGVVVIDKDYNEVFGKIFEGSDTWVNGSFADGSGSFCYVVYTNDSEEGTFKQLLKKVNRETKEFEDVFDWPANTGSDTMISGSGEYISYFYNYNSASVEGLKSDGTMDEVVNLLNNGLYLNQVSAMYADGDDFYIMGYDGQPQLYRLRRLEASEIKEKVKVTLAAYYSSTDLQNAVADYNKSDGNYLIAVTDYSRYNDYSGEDEEAWNAGLTKLNAEISAGQIPDIISISDPEMIASYSSKGLLADLNTYIDGENGLNREEYFDNIFRAMETDGKLYTITPSVGIQGYCVKQSLVPNDGPLTWEEADSILNQNSGMTLLSADTSRESFMYSVLSCGYRNFVNTSTGECSFNSPEFVEILERSMNYPEEIDYDALNNDMDFWANYELQFRKGQVLLDRFYFYGFDSYYYEADGKMGEDISLVGMPGSGGGAYLAPMSYYSVSSQSAYPEAGWELISSMLEYDEDRYSNARFYGMGNFPVNKRSFRQMGEAAIEATYYTDENGNRVQQENSYYLNDNEQIILRNVDQPLIDRTESFISSCDNVFMGIEEGISDIIKEESAAFYAGTASAQQAADNIQSRVSLYLSEHM